MSSNPPNIMASLGIPEKLGLIKENLVEVLNLEIIESVLASGQNPKIYWGMCFYHLVLISGRLAKLCNDSDRSSLSGTATTGRPHCGYFVPAIKIAQFLAADCEVICLIADM
jgi:tyrosyl-tRNA synthetase